MGQFAGFHTGKDIDTTDNDVDYIGAFAPTKIKREHKEQEKTAPTKTKSKQVEQWEKDFLKCSSQAEFQSYIYVHQCDKDNPFVEQAFAKLKDLKSYTGNNNSGGKNELYSSTSDQQEEFSSISLKQIWIVIKKTVAVIVVLFGLVVVYVWYTNDKTPGRLVGAYFGIVVPSVCAWAFGNND
jgi:hypothetical protein